MKTLLRLYRLIVPLQLRHRLYRTRTTVARNMAQSGTPIVEPIRNIPANVQPILDALRPLPGQWHEAGTLSIKALEAIAHHLYAVEMPLLHTLETGCGKSTVLLSNISAHHQVFALSNMDNSWDTVMTFPLTNKETVHLINGPTQRTMLKHNFEHKIQFALIDGPHGYPFPDIEYYFIYPHLEENALLVIDDIHIPNIKNLFDFLCADEMFHLEEVISTTAIFRRTSAPTFDPTGDSWWKQGYNHNVAAYYLKTYPSLLN